jgi:hypothetical protein
MSGTTTTVLLPDTSGLDLPRAIASAPTCPRCPSSGTARVPTMGGVGRRCGWGAVDCVNKGQTGWLALLDRVKFVVPSRCARRRPTATLSSEKNDAEPIRDAGGQE